MHMTCQAPCKFEFCWLCMGAWKEHGERTGGFYACNRYESARSTGEFEEGEKRRLNAKQSHERYLHYYERWNAHGQAHKKALELLADMTDQRLHTRAPPPLHPAPCCPLTRCDGGGAYLMGGLRRRARRGADWATCRTRRRAS